MVVTFTNASYAFLTLLCYYRLYEVTSCNKNNNCRGGGLAEPETSGWRASQIVGVAPIHNLWSHTWEWGFRKPRGFTVGSLRFSFMYETVICKPQQHMMFSKSSIMHGICQEKFSEIELEIFKETHFPNQHL